MSKTTETSRNQSGISRMGLIVAVSASLLLLVAVYFAGRHSAQKKTLQFETAYQAVLLSNGNVYFGKLADYGTTFPVLTDIYYIQSSVVPGGKEPVNVLVKRGKELHAPDRMYLNPNQIIMVETVGPTSKIADLISEQQKKK
jgi:hypothetical protein